MSSFFKMTLRYCFWNSSGSQMYSVFNSPAFLWGVFGSLDLPMGEDSIGIIGVGLICFAALDVFMDPNEVVSSELKFVQGSVSQDHGLAFLSGWTQYGPLVK
jgi:hypothetical protein